jgi:excisionase family DNA binding protein
MAEEREVMNIRQAAGYLGVSADTLYKYASEEKVPAFKLGNRWRFKKSKLDEWMEDQSTANAKRPVEAIAVDQIAAGRKSRAASAK